MKIDVLANTGFSDLGVSGGDRIFIELSKIWSENNEVKISTWPQPYKVCINHGLKKVKYDTVNINDDKLFLPLLYMERTLIAILKAFKVSSRDIPDLLFSSSDFWPDAIPALILKLRFKRIKWIAAFYFFAPTFFYSHKDIAYRGGRFKLSFRSVCYYLTQRISYLLIRKYADFILACNQLDKDIFVKDGVSEDKILAIYGGVDFKYISGFPGKEIIYDACFVGRLHRQKGPLELLEIWQRVIKNKPDAKLAIIGNGPLENTVKKMINKMNLSRNIDLLGYMDGEKKYNIFKSSRIFVHPPILDTGGMAAAEGMAAGLPVVGFDLPGYKYCYPKGMLKAPIGDLEGFAKLILDLLNDDILYNKMKEEALNFSKVWDWQEKAALVWEKIKGL